MCRSSGRDAHALGDQPGQDLGGERPPRAGHLGRTRLGDVDVLIGRDREAALHVPVADGPSVARQVGVQRLGRLEEGDPEANAGAARTRRVRRQEADAAAPGERDARPGLGQQEGAGPPGATPPSTARPEAGSRDGPARPGRRHRCRRASAAKVPDVLRTTRSPSSRKRGSSEKCECTSEPSPLCATSIRTESRVMPRASGGEGASSSGGKANDSGCRTGRVRRELRRGHAALSITGFPITGFPGGHAVTSAPTSSPAR